MAITVSRDVQLLTLDIPFREFKDVCDIYGNNVITKSSETWCLHRLQNAQDRSS